MKISDIYSAKGLKLKFTFEDSSVSFASGMLIRIDTSQKEREYLISKYAYEEGTESKNPVLAKTDSHSAGYLRDLFDGEKSDSFKCLFSIEGVGNSYIEVQAYTFRTVTEYKTPIFIQVPANVLKKTTLEKLQNEYIWGQLGEPAIFSLNYKNKKKQRDNVRFVSGKHYLYAVNTPRGIVVEGESYLKDRYEVPVDIYLAPEIKFVEETDSLQVNDGFASDLDKVSNPASYFARWEAYNELSKKLLEKESEEFGEIKYIEFTEKTDLNGTTYIFEIDEELDESFIGKEVGVREQQSAEQQEEGNLRPRDTAVGAIRKINGRKIVTYKEAQDINETVPRSGVITLYTAGDRSIMARRDVARDRMVKHLTPIKSIVALIETGASEYELPSSWGSHKAVTEKLIKNFPKAKSINPEQEEALKTAINSPDIALIQGPPGTGKTTVIKAICERFREIYEAEEQRKKKEDEEHILRSPKILISSFQNEAVDNAISAPLPGDIPAYRKMAKRAKNGSQEQYQKSLDKWYTDLSVSINELIKDKETSEYVTQKNLLNDEFLSYKNADEPIEEAAKIIKHYLSFAEVVYPSDLVESSEKIIKAANNDGEDDLPDPVVSRLESQRLDIESFNDDGERAAQRLLAHLRIRDDLEIEGNVIEAIEGVCDNSFSPEQFSKYVKVINELKKQYCKKKSTINVRDKSVVNECILSMNECFSNQFMKSLTDIESKKSLILSEFISKLEQEYENVVRKYSMTTAATCQTCLDFRETEKTYDLVIIDEAARANPLDLFIPMSMGKKIILVGDHKQLPHMLEPDVLKLIMDDPKFKDLPEIEKSLFERMFSMFSKGNKTKSILLTHQYRMHPEICKFVSDEFYDSELKTAEEITPELRKSPVEINAGRALTVIDIPITKGKETDGASKSRLVEAEAIAQDLKKILEIDKGASIGVITFYSAQSKVISNQIDKLLDEEEKENVEVGTVDAFQGKEFDYVLLSCVRSNIDGKDATKHNVGFLEKPNRLCVAFSRAKRQLAVYGDMDTLIQIPCFEHLYNICAVEGGGCHREY